MIGRCAILLTPVLMFLFATFSFARCELFKNSLEIVFHASVNTDLTIIEPRTSSHGKPWVYGTRSVGIAAAYLGRWSDFDLAQFVVNGMAYLVERYPGALKKAFGGYRGAIYAVSSSTFLDGETSFSGEVVSPVALPVLRKWVVANSLDFVISLIHSGEIVFYEYPDRPKSIPKDDSDILRKAARLISQGRSKYEYFVNLHPHLKDRLDEQLNEIENSN